MSIASLVLTCLLFIGVVLTLSHQIDKGRLPTNLIHNPITYALALGICASSWALFGSIGYASTEGYNALSFYFGVATALLFAPIVIFPILRLTTQYNLRSLSDLYTLRYRSKVLGQFTTLIMAAATILMFVLQLQSVIGSIERLLGYQATTVITGIAFIISLAVSLFYGGSRTARLNRHTGLVFSVAVASAIKLLTFIVLMGFILFAVFDSPSHMQAWFANNISLQDTFYQPLDTVSWYSGFWLLFFGIILMPHFYQIIFNESQSPRKLRIASLIVPFYILIICTSLPLIMMAADKLHLTNNPNYWILEITQRLDHSWFILLFFLACVGSALSVVIVSTLALSNAFVTYFHLPISQKKDGDDMVKWLLIQKRLSITLLLSFSFLIFFLINNNVRLSYLGLLSFSLIIQLLPALIGTLTWTKANSTAVLSGLIVGCFFWLILLLLPVLMQYNVFYELLFTKNLSSISHSVYPVMTTLLLNICVFTGVSLLTKQSQAEKESANMCVLNDLGSGYYARLNIDELSSIIDRLTPQLGQARAQKTIDNVLKRLPSFDIKNNQHTMRLREYLETELSGLVGPASAFDLVAASMPIHISPRKPIASLEQQLDYQLKQHAAALPHVTRDLSKIRQYYRQLLTDMPIAICGLDENYRIIEWNTKMQQLTLSKRDALIGTHISNLPVPWSQWLEELVSHHSNLSLNKSVTLDNRTHYFDLQKSQLNNNYAIEGLALYKWLIIIEDTTEKHALQQQLIHKERLASIGGLAAGVAHEIGNPVTGIACLAQELSEEIEDSELKDLADSITEQTQRIDYILKDLIDFSHKGESQSDYRTVSINDIIVTAAKLFALHAESNPVRFDFQSEQRVKINPQQIEQVIINLLNNARDACADKSLPISIKTVDIDSQVVISISDQGEGIDETVKARIFDPFVTTKAVGKGTGLGLSLVHGIISEHQGTIDVTSPMPETGKGTQFTLTLNAI